MKTILVPFDFSEEAQNALEFAEGLASKINAHLQLVHVIELPGSQSFNTMGEASLGGDQINQIYMIELMDKRKKQMAELRENYADRPFKFSTKLLFGNPYAGISKEIAEEKADIVVMGSKGSSGLEEFLIGSNTEKVVRYADCPVITIKKAITVDKISKIVFASDFKEKSNSVMKQLKKIQEMLDADLYLVKINTPSLFESSRTSKKTIAEFAKKHNLDNTHVEIYNSSSEEEGIIEYAEDIDADMIAMATHGRTGFLHLLSGSIAEDVVNHAKRPVWTMKVK
ncbi:universal stress protein [Pararhodonellum marinum]|uniref:universal stress protein n=1 Tax=Pararhodonellum marinum TaxID=2755358 RepID=UPI00188FD921|nr:universal stress protein [Pararhodonellum marinum]